MMHQPELVDQGRSIEDLDDHGRKKRQFGSTNAEKQTKSSTRLRRKRSCRVKREDLIEVHKDLANLTMLVYQMHEQFNQELNEIRLNVQHLCERGGQLAITKVLNGDKSTNDPIFVEQQLPTIKGGVQEPISIYNSLTLQLMNNHKRTFNLAMVETTIEQPQEDPKLQVVADTTLNEQQLAIIDPQLERQATEPFRLRAHFDMNASDPANTPTQGTIPKASVISNIQPSDALVPFDDTQNLNKVNRTKHQKRRKSIKFLPKEVKRTKVSLVGKIKVKANKMSGGEEIASGEESGS
ncbi:unnamed protein product [Citrullus colocynthis]|uniref:Uncharacterized protein n=1 Tax=Citrullus colocynthis TaxID=252529 RepID=A0ABP0YFY4_9ROSI